jgi:hypothetical protein
MTKNAILRYFDLNERARKGENDYIKKQAEKYRIHNEIIKKQAENMAIHNEIAIPENIDTVKEVSPDEKLSRGEQIIMVIGVFLGVLLSSAILSYEKGNIFNFSSIFTLGNIVISFFVSIIILPKVYEKLRIKTDTSFLLQFAFFFQNGVFWHVLFSSLGKMV